MKNSQNQMSSNDREETYKAQEKPRKSKHYHSEKGNKTNVPKVSIPKVPNVPIPMIPKRSGLIVTKNGEEKVNLMEKITPVKPTNEQSKKLKLSLSEFNG